MALSRINPKLAKGIKYTVNSVAEMVAFTELPLGARVTTRGYYSQGDGGGNEYVIIDSEATTDGGWIIPLDNDYKAEGLFPDGISPLQWGARGNGFADDTTAVQKCFDYAQEFSERTDTTSKSAQIDGKGKQFALSSTVILRSENAQVNLNLTAHTSWDTPTDPLLLFNSTAAYSTFTGKLDCKGLAAGIHCRAGRSSLNQIDVRHFRTFGVKLGDESGTGAGTGDIWIKGGAIQQWTPDQPEFTDLSEYDADAIVVDRPDIKIWGVGVRWAGRLVYCTENSNTVKIMGCHLVNDGAGKMVRPNPIGIETDRIGNIVLEGCYLDNARHLIRAKRCSIEGCQYIYLTDRVSISTSLFTFYPYADGEYPDHHIGEIHSFSGWNLDLVRYRDEGAYSWPMPSAAIEAVVNRGHSVRVTGPSVEAIIPDGDGNIAKTFVTTKSGSADGCRIILMDRDTTSESTASGIRSAGDVLVAFSNEYISLVGDKGVRLPRLSSAPTNPVNGIIYFDTTTDQFKGWNGSTWVTFG